MLHKFGMHKFENDQERSNALVEASYLAGFSMVTDPGETAAVDDAYAFADDAARKVGNPWNMPRRPARRRWAKDAIETFARRLDEVSVRPKPLTSTALVVWTPPKPAVSWFGAVARALSLPFNRHPTLG